MAVCPFLLVKRRNLRRVLDNRPAGEVRWTNTTPCRISRRVTWDTDPLLPEEEADWIRAAQAGDRSAFARLIERYWDRLFRWLYHLTRDRHTAEDLTQETFLKALAAIRSFRPGSNFRAWIFRIGHNNFVNQKRSERRTKHQLPEDAASPEQVGLVEATTEHRETLQAVGRAVSDLPSDFRAALLLRVNEGLSFREVARILKTTEETARWRVFKARQKLMRVLSPELLPPGAAASEAKE
jgi:RNA polymerase sigma-70 factor, ECF subfamily